MTKRLQKKPRLEHFLLVRVIITIVVLFFIAVIVILNIRGSTILAVLGVIFALLQWLFPFPASKHEKPITTPSMPQDTAHIPPSLSPTQSPATKTLVYNNVVELPSTIDSQPPQQGQISTPGIELTKLETVQLRFDSVFLFNEPLTDPKEFYGRVRDRKTLINRTNKGISTSIVGPRRIGKTWLISYLRLVAPTELGTHFRIGYLDATLASCATVVGFIEKVFEEFNISFVHDYANLELAMLEKVVQNLKLKNQVPILCIDEFEGFGNRKVFDLGFFSGLRAITQVGLGLVVTSKRPLIDVVGDDGKTSGFFNIFEQLTLKPFNLKEAEAFVRDKSIQGRLTEQERAYLLKYGGKDGQQWPPIRLQLAGKMLLEDKSLAAEGDIDDYYPDDPKYWEAFEERLEEKYRGVIR